MPNGSTPGSEVLIDKNSLSVNEIVLVEKVTGVPFEDIGGRGGLTKALQAFALVALRRQNGTPAYDPIADGELNQAGELDTEEINAVLGKRPTRAAGPPYTSRSPKSTKQRGSPSNGSRR